MDKLFWPVVALLMGGAVTVSGGCRGSGGGIPFSLVDQPQAWAVLAEQPAYVVVTEGNWQAYYGAVPPQADFNSKFYVVASWGTKPNPGYRISVTGVKQSGATVEVRVRLDEPDPGKVYAQVIVRPTAVAEISKSSLQQRGSLTFQFIDQKGNRLARTESRL
ncbi:MAG: protease complex subunit PrcB family protein [Chloroflexi bacterium]|nr:protease complex subunit PrcB family protein [Chloroflexota bacterium]